MSAAKASWSRYRRKTKPSAAPFEKGTQGGFDAAFPLARVAQRMSLYALLRGPSGALHLAIFDQPLAAREIETKISLRRENHINQASPQLLPAYSYSEKEHLCLSLIFNPFFKPLLEVATDGNEHSLKTAREIIAKKMQLSENDLNELLPSGNQTKFENRVAWAKTYFVQAKVLKSPKRGYFLITDRGRDLLKKGHEKIDVKILNQYPEFVEFHTAKAGKTGSNSDSGSESPAETPEETLQKAYQRH